MFSKLFLRKLVKPNKLINSFSTRNYAQTTALHDFHVNHGGKMVDFSGFLLPVQYADQSIINSHLHTRKSSSLFDVSHMLQTEITGTGCIEYMESIVPADIRDLPVNSSVLTIFTNANGGILDDLIVTKVTNDFLYVVSNAGQIEHDKKHFLDSSKNKGLKIHFHEPKDKSLIAIQGPMSAQILQPLLNNINLTNLYFMTSIEANIFDIPNCRLTRCGYTGEDGFELSVSANKVVLLVEKLLENPSLKLAGLGARDSLRLEAGLCLYGCDISVDTTPSEAALNWLIPKTRRTGQRHNFPGSEVILKQITSGVATKKRIGLISTNSGPPARHGTLIMDAQDKNKQIGEVTSGCPSPSMQGTNIAMGYVNARELVGKENVALKIRDKLYDAKIAKMPFVKANYYNKPK